MNQKDKSTYLLWICFALCVLSATAGEQYADGIEELTASILLFVVAILSDKIIAWLMLFLVVGKLIDGQQNPHDYGAGELIWDTLAFIGAVILYFYRRNKKTT